MSIKSAALELLLEKMDPISVAQYGVTLIVDVLEEMDTVCPRMCIEICDKTIATFSKIKEKIWEKCAEQLKECEETGECVTKRKAEERETQEKAKAKTEETEKRIFVVGPNGENVEMSGTEVFDKLKRALRDGLAIKIDDDGNIDRSSLPEDMPEEMKNKLCVDVPRISKMLGQFSECKTDEERTAFLKLLRMNGDDSVWH